VHTTHIRNDISAMSCLIYTSKE